jgi:hypothetical protein
MLQSKQGQTSSQTAENRESGNFAIFKIISFVKVFVSHSPFDWIEKREAMRDDMK